MLGNDFYKINSDKDDLNNDRRDLDFENMKKAHSDYLKMLQSGNHGRNGFIQALKFLVYKDFILKTLGSFLWESLHKIKKVVKKLIRKKNYLMRKLKIRL